MKNNNPYISDQGHYMTQGLFYEYRHQTKNFDAPYNLREDDYKGSKSVYKIYMSCDTEYEAAQKILGSWKHWEILCKSPFFSKEIEKWREERAIREQALAKGVLLEQTREGNITAAKGVLETHKRKAGRPSKIEVEGERKRQANIDSKVSSIVERMSKHL